jgi:transposase
MTPAREKELLAENARLRADIERLALENKLLHEKVDLILSRFYGRSSESIDPSRPGAPVQLDFFNSDAGKKTAATAADPGPVTEVPAPEAAPAKSRAPRKLRDLSSLPVVETVLTCEEVAADPDAYRLVERIVTDRLDYQPGRLLIQRTVREVHVAKDDPDAAPIKPAAPPSLGLAATPRFTAYVTASKYCHHRPHYRTEEILLRRHGVRVPRHTLCHSDKVVAETIEPLYKLLHRGLLATGNLQADETPVHYLDPGKGRTSIGFFWVLHAPRCGIKGDILYQWHPSRRAACLDDLLPDYQGALQTDAYAAYASWAGGKARIDHAACWAHARREFHEALKIGQRLAAGPLATIAELYRIEAALRQSGATPERRSEVRRQKSMPVLEILKSELIALRQHPEILPKGRLGRAIDYTLALWDRLLLFVERGEIEIDNNLTENGIRPTAIGKKNWLFIGSEKNGQRAAIIYTMIECAKRAGHDPEAWLADVLERLPAMSNQDDLSVLLPSNWQPAAAVGGPVRETCAV